MKNKTIRLLVITMFLALVLAAGSCGRNNTEKGSSVGKSFVSDENHYVSAENFSGTYLPKANAPSETINYIDLRSAGNNDIFLGVALQGIVNKGTPSLYVFSNPMVEGNESSEYWFDLLDVTYPNRFVKNEYTDIYRLVADYADKLDGYILYHDRLCDGKMRSRSYYRSLYGDMACLDLTVMLASKYNAVPLTQSQYNTLKNKYGVTLEMKGDTTYFMEKDSDGHISASNDARASRDTWKKVFNYVLNKLSGDLNNKVFAHNAGFCIASADYWIQNNALVYSRIFDNDATDEEKEIEDKLLALTDVNAVSLGVWYLQADEGSYVAKLSSSQKTMIVTYETYNLSWTSGLESVYPKANEPRDLEPEDGKIYISFDLTEGDNVSYASFRLNQILDSPAAPATTMGWTFTPTLGEIAPNMQAYYNTRIGGNYSVVTPEQGVAYVSYAPENDDFYTATAEYLDRLNSDTVRILRSDMVDCLVYAEKIDGLNGVFVGYMGEGATYWNNNEDANILYNDTVFFKHYNGRSLSDIANYNSGAPAFFAVSLYGWGQSAETVEAVTKDLDDRFVIVSPSELAALYKKYVAKSFSDVTYADFDCDMSQAEMGFMTYASDHTAVSASDGTRYADGNDYMVYKFDLDDGVSSAAMYLTLSGRYQVAISADNVNWKIIDESKNHIDSPVIKQYDVSSYLNGNAGNTVYLRVANASPEYNGGAALHHVSVLTEKYFGKSLTLTPANDAAFIAEGEKTYAEDGRTGSFVYAIPVSGEVKDLSVSVLADPGKKVEISSDGREYAEITFDGTAGSTRYADISDCLTGKDAKLYFRFGGEGKAEKFRLLSSVPVKEESFSPMGSSKESEYALCIDNGEIVSPNTVNSFRRLRGTEELLYKFIIDRNVQKVRLDLNILGTYSVKIGTDGKNFTEVVRAQTGGSVQVRYVYTDISAYVGGGDTLYVKAGLIDPSKETVVRFYGIRIMTDLSSDSMKQRFENERLPDLEVLASWNGINRGGNVNYGEEDTESFEYKLIDWSLSVSPTIYLHNLTQPLRGLASNEGCFVYKFDFSQENLAFWQEILPDVFASGKPADFRIGIDIAEGYIIDVSTDGEVWKTLVEASVDDTYRGGASNRTTEKLFLGEYLEQSDVIYIRCADNTPQNGWGALVFALNLYFN